MSDDVGSSMYASVSPNLKETCVDCSAMQQSIGPTVSYLCMPFFGAKNPNDRLEWPVSTNVLCWHCCHRFDTLPIAIPHAHDAERDVYTVLGVFCGFSCAKAYILEHHSCSSPTRLVLLGEMAERMYGVCEAVAAAPPRRYLKSFGGTMEIEEFRRRGASVRSFAREPKFVPHSIVFEERSVGTAAAEDERATDADDDDGALHAVAGTRVRRHAATAKPVWSIRGLRVRPTPPAPAQDQPLVIVQTRVPERPSMFQQFIDGHRENATVEHAPTESGDAQPTEEDARAQPPPKQTKKPVGTLTSFLRQ